MTAEIVGVVVRADPRGEADSSGDGLRRPRHERAVPGAKDGELRVRWPRERHLAEMLVREQLEEERGLERVELVTMNAAAPPTMTMAAATTLATKSAERDSFIRRPHLTRGQACLAVDVAERHPCPRRHVGERR